MTPVGYDGTNFQASHERFHNLDLWGALRLSHKSKRDVDNEIYVELAMIRLGVQLWAPLKG